MRHRRTFFYESELYRLRASIVLRTAPRAEAGTQHGPPEGGPHVLLRRALDVARSQGARALELRAATDLADLLIERGESRSARQLLQPVYDAFDEGFDTADLMHARRVLDLANA